MKTDTGIKPSGWRAWWLAARPKTLSGAMIPVLVGTALAHHDGHFRLVVALLCLAFAGLMQIAANFINDFYDYKRGTDGADRLGPERACAQGWISPTSMKRGIACSLFFAAFVGLLALIASGAWIDFSEKGYTIDWEKTSWIASIGLACIVFAFLYTTMLSYIGGGDLLVYVFFGFVPVLGTYYLQALRLTPAAWLLGAACGIIIDTLLILNNYRDRDTDKVAGKRTLIVVFGEKFGNRSYLLHGLAGTALACSTIAVITDSVAALLPLLYFIPHVKTWREMIRIHTGKSLNRILGQTSRNMLIFALFVCIALLF